MNLSIGIQYRKQELVLMFTPLTPLVNKRRVKKLHVSMALSKYQNNIISSLTYPNIITYFRQTDSNTTETSSAMRETSSYYTSVYHSDFRTHAIPSPDFPGLSYSLMPNSLTGIVCHDGWDQNYTGRI